MTPGKSLNLPAALILKFIYLVLMSTDINIGVILVLDNGYVRLILM